MVARRLGADEPVDVVRGVYVFVFSYASMSYLGSHLIHVSQRGSREHHDIAHPDQRRRDHACDWKQVRGDPTAWAVYRLRNNNFCMSSGDGSIKVEPLANADVLLFNGGVLLGADGAV